VDFALTDEQLALQAEAREVGRAAAARAEVTEDSWMVGVDREFSVELGRRGWLGMTWPTEVGGGGRPPIDRLLVAEQLISAGAPLAYTWFADRQMGPTLIQFGTPEQQDRYLPGILDGTEGWAIGMSEPDAGSNLAGIRTKAVREGDAFRVTGQKIWTSGAHLANYVYLICRTDPDAPPHKGMSELVVPLDIPGITIVPITDITGDRHFNEVYFEDVEVPAENLVGQLNGSFGQVMRQLEHERGGIDRLVSNKALFDAVVPLADPSDPIVRQERADLETGFRIGRLLVLREVLGQAPAGFSAATKTFCTDVEQRVAVFCARVLGAHALLAEPGLPRRVGRALCYARAYTIMGGTAEILHNILGERVLGLPKEPR
jgi:alkylation response protein AidB-like acyl-CoA dehydrogenase